MISIGNNIAIFFQNFKKIMIRWKILNNLKEIKKIFKILRRFLCNPKR